MLLVHTTYTYNGVLTSTPIAKGEVIMELKGIHKPFRNRYSIQLQENMHLHPFENNLTAMKQLVWPFLNHSCNPSAFINTDTLQLIALKNIHANEEITFDYETTESILSEPFQCNCKSPNCKSLIQGSVKAIQLS